MLIWGHYKLKKGWKFHRETGRLFGRNWMIWTIVDIFWAKVDGHRPKNATRLNYGILGPSNLRFQNSLCRPSSFTNDHSIWLQQVIMSHYFVTYSWQRPSLWICKSSLYWRKWAPVRLHWQLHQMNSYKHPRLLTWLQITHSRVSQSKKKGQINWLFWSDRKWP